MPTFYGYSPDGLVYTPGSNSWSLASDYTHHDGRVRISIRDEADTYLDGDSGANEVGDQADQIGRIHDMDSNQIASGQIYSEEYHELTSPSGDTIYIDVLEIGGVLVGFATSEPLQPGVSYQLNGTYNTDEDNSADYLTIASVPCFGPNTRITTSKGMVPVKWLRRGDRVLTRDFGFQPLRWAGRFQVPHLQMRREPQLAPVRVPAWLVDADRTTGYLETSQEHRIVVSGADVQLLFGEDEVFVAAKFLAEPTIPEISFRSYTYFHLLFHRHHVIQADGVWTESLLVLPPEAHLETAADMAPPRGIYHARTARTCLTREQTELLVTLRQGRDAVPHRLTA